MKTQYQFREPKPRLNLVSVSEPEALFAKASWIMKQGCIQYVFRVLT